MVEAYGFWLTHSSQSDKKITFQKLAEGLGLVDKPDHGIISHKDTARDAIARAERIRRADKRDMRRGRG